MHVTDLPINKALGMQLAAPGSTHLLDLPESPLGLNHLGTIHASAQFALAEACSGEFLIQSLGEEAEQVFAVLRASEVKFRKPAHGHLRATARVVTETFASIVEELVGRGRVLVLVDVQIADSNGVTTMSGQFTWFLQKQLATS